MSEKTTDKSVIKCLGFCGFGMGANITEVDVKDGRVARIRPLHYDQLYTPEELNAWKIEARGHVLEPGMKCVYATVSAGVQDGARIRKNRIPYPMKRVDWNPGGERSIRRTAARQQVRAHQLGRGMRDHRRRDQAHPRRSTARFSILGASRDGHGETQERSMLPHGCHDAPAGPECGGFTHAGPPARQLGGLVLGCQACLGHGSGRACRPSPRT